MENEFTISNLFIGLILMSAIVIGSIGVISHFQSYHQVVDTTKLTMFNTTFNQYEELSSTSNNMLSSLQNSQNKSFIEKVADVINGLVLTGWNTLKFVFGSFALMTAVFGGLYPFFGVAIWVGNVIMTLITISVSFAIIKILTGLK